MKRIRRAATAFVLGSVALSLSACSADDTTPAAQTPPTAVESTPAAKEETPEEFIRRWFEVSRDMQNSGDTSEYLAMTSGCSYCEETAARIEGFYAAGGYVTYDGDHIQSIDPYLDHKNRFLVMLQARSTTYAPAAGEKAKHLEGGEIEYVVTLVEEGTGWHVRNMHRFGG